MAVPVVAPSTCERTPKCHFAEFDLEQAVEEERRLVGRGAFKKGRAFAMSNLAGLERFVDERRVEQQFVRDEQLREGVNVAMKCPTTSSCHEQGPSWLLIGSGARELCGVHRLLSRQHPGCLTGCLTAR
jgi:hypothetical protein